MRFTALSFTAFFCSFTKIRNTSNAQTRLVRQQYSVFVLYLSHFVVGVRPIGVLPIRAAVVGAFRRWKLGRKSEIKTRFFALKNFQERFIHRLRLRSEFGEDV